MIFSKSKPSVAAPVAAFIETPIAAALTAAVLPPIQVLDETLGPSEVPSLFLEMHARALKALEDLETADPLKYVSDSRHAMKGEDSVARQAVERACVGAPSEVMKRVLDEFFACGPLETLLVSECTEIIVNGRDSIWYESAGVLHRHNDIFHSALSYRNFISRLSREASMIASLDCPFADGRWRDLRVHLIIPPASGDEAVITLRRLPRNPWSFTRLEENGWATRDQMAALRSLVNEKKNFLVIGGTGSGKTSVLNACLSEIRSDERAVIIEDTSELARPNSVSSKLLSRHDPQGHLKNIDQADLLKQALRMRPDRLVMGEIRGGEAKDLLMAFATGHRGCLGTLHADNARQALLRLEMLIQIGAPQWNVNAVRSLIFLSLQAVVVVGRTEGGARELEGIYRIASLEDVGFLIERIA